MIGWSRQLPVPDRSVSYEKGANYTQMRVRIHRGTKEVGGNCIELASDGKTVLLDMGMPLTAPDPAK